MPRSLKVNQDFIGAVKLALKRSGWISQRALSEDLGLALSTVSNFLNGKPIDRAILKNFALSCPSIGKTSQSQSQKSQSQKQRPTQQRLTPILPILVRIKIGAKRQIALFFMDAPMS
ncbi:MAG TPA: helix-turn-helix transcriptional regulator [Coleofasciculaceae cyanobacterium]|jgi:hypothetical protein